MPIARLRETDTRWRPSGAIETAGYTTVGSRLEDDATACSGGWRMPRYVLSEALDKGLSEEEWACAAPWQGSLGASSLGRCSFPLRPTNG